DRIAGLAQHRDAHRPDRARHPDTRGLAGPADQVVLRARGAAALAGGDGAARGHRAARRGDARLRRRGAQRARPAGAGRLDELGVIDGWYWMRGTLEVQLAEKASGKVRGNKRWEIKTSSRQKATAQRRALDEADATLKRELRPAILRFAVGN